MLISYTFTKPVKILFWFRKSVKNPKQGTISCRLSLNGDLIEISTGHTLPKNKWNTNRKKAIGDDLAHINDYLEELTRAIREIEKEKEVRNLSGKKKLQKIKELLQPAKEEELVQEQIKDLNWLFQNYHCVKFGPGSKMADSTRRSIKSKVKNCQRFIDQENIGSCLVSDFKTNQARQFYTWCLAQDYSHNSAVKFCTYFKEAFKLAIEEGVVYNNPFKSLNLSESEVERPFLKIDQIKELENGIFKSEVKRSVDQFLLLTYTGMSISDLPKLKPENFRELNGRTWLTYVRKKSKINQPHLTANIPIFPEVISILARYENKVPINCGQVVNRNLKIAEKQLQMTVHLTTKIARKTCADILINEKGLSIDSVAAILGNTIRTVVKNYANVRQQRIEMELVQNDMKLILVSKN